MKLTERIVVTFYMFRFLAFVVISHLLLVYVTVACGARTTKTMDVDSACTGSVYYSRVSLQQLALSSTACCHKHKHPHTSAGECFSATAPGLRTRATAYWPFFLGMKRDFFGNFFPPASNSIVVQRSQVV